MDGVLRPNPADQDRLEAWLPCPTPQCHAANLAELENGDLACVWFAGTQEGTSDISIRFARLPRGGTRWSESELVTNDMTRSEQNPILFRTPEGTLWLLYTSQVAGDQDTAVVKLKVSNDDGRTFGPARILLGEPGTFVRQPIVVNRRGEWLLPVFLCSAEPGQKWRGDTDASAVRISRDGGRTWSLVEVPDSIGAVHMNIAPIEGDRLLAVYRSRFADAVKRSVSVDGGHSWSAPAPTDLPNNNSSIQMIRLASGRHAIVYNHMSAAMSSERRAGLYDEIEGHEATVATSDPAQPGAIWGVPRAPLTVALSEDEGRTFPIRRDLEVGDGSCLSNDSIGLRNREFSYPSIHQTTDGRIHVAFTYYRQAIKHVRISEDWILRGRGPGVARQAGGRIG